MLSQGHQDYRVPTPFRIFKEPLTLGKHFSSLLFVSSIFPLFLMQWEGSAATGVPSELWQVFPSCIKSTNVQTSILRPAYHLHSCRGRVSRILVRPGISADDGVTDCWAISFRTHWRQLAGKAPGLKWSLFNPLGIDQSVPRAWYWLAGT